MIKIEAQIKLYSGTLKRKTPFHTGYRPLFEFIPEMKTSGHIDLIDRSKFFPGEEGKVKIVFVKKEFLGNDFRIGKKFYFFESKEALGEGRITKIL